MGLVAGIDAGTQSLKVLVYDPQAQTVAAATSALLTLDSAADGSREQAPADWVAALHDCLPGSIPRCAHASSRWRSPASSMGSCRWMRQAVLAPAKLWCDTSTSAECAQIMDAVGGVRRTIALAGNPILAGYTASKLPWTRTHRADAYARLATILLPHDYLNFVLTGQRLCEHGDVRNRGWRALARRCATALDHPMRCSISRLRQPRWGCQRR